MCESLSTIKQKFFDIFSYLYAQPLYLIFKCKSYKKVPESLRISHAAYQNLKSISTSHKKSKFLPLKMEPQKRLNILS